MMNINNLRDSIISKFSPMYLLNDKAHRVEHFEEVYQTGILINERLNLGYNEKLILIVAYFHDLFAWSRVNHHELSKKFIETTDLPIIVNLTEEERKMVAAACGEHRSSFKGSYTYQFSELMAAADRGIPSSNINGMLERAINYRLNGNNLTVDDVIDDAKNHLKEKFTRDDVYNSMYISCFKEELIARKRAIMAL